jgi:hypothetical protein
MSVIALGTWIAAALGGLFLLAIWVIEYDADFQRSAATRLPPPVLTAHALLALTGLVVWVMYLVAGSEQLARLAAALLLAVALLGTVMAARWVGVYRAHPARASRDAGTREAIPPERNFPLPIVMGHGIFAVTTLVLVLLTVLGIAGSLSAARGQPTSASRVTNE